MALSARKTGEGFVLDGVKSVVPHGDQAELLFVSARTAGERYARDGISLFRVDAKAKGVTRRAYPLADGTPGAEIRLDNVVVPADALVGEAGKGLVLIERVTQEAIAALCAEAVGVMSAMGDMTVTYLKTRKQFGRPIGAFQALQHRAADMFIALEQARSMAVYATMMVGETDPAARAAAISAAKVTIGRERPLHRRAGRAIAWRDRHDDGVSPRRLFQAHDRHQFDVRRRRSPFAQGRKGRRTRAKDHVIQKTHD